MATQAHVRRLAMYHHGERWKRDISRNEPTVSTIEEKDGRKE